MFAFDRFFLASNNRKRAAIVKPVAGVAKKNIKRTI